MIISEAVTLLNNQQQIPALVIKQTEVHTLLFSWYALLWLILHCYATLTLFDCCIVNSKMLKNFILLSLKMLKDIVSSNVCKNVWKLPVRTEMEKSSNSYSTLSTANYKSNKLLNFILHECVSYEKLSANYGATIKTYSFVLLIYWCTTVVK